MRYFLIDKVTELVVGERARGRKAVTLTDEILHDHFPDFPVLPGALILEGAAQLAGFLLEQTFFRRDAPPLRAILAQVRSAKFYDFAGPGDVLEISTELTSRLARAAECRFEVMVESKRIARGQLTFAMREIQSERVNEQRRYVYKLWTRDLTTPVEFP